MGDNVPFDSAAPLLPPHFKSLVGPVTASHVCGSDTAREETATEKLQSIEETKEYLLSRTVHRPKVAIICGTGLGGLADLLTDSVSFKYTDIPHFLPGTVPGHAGRLIFGLLAGKCVVCMQGRVHAYEGHSMWKVTFPVRVFGAMGVEILLATNASGGLNPDYSAGDVMILKDHINLAGLAGLNPFVGLNDDRFGPRFCAMSGAYDKQLREIAWEASRQLGCKFVREGVYLCQIGPCFESIAESRMIRQWGADATGMSTVFEVSVARHVGLRCLGLSLVTNMCIVDYDTPQVAASHAETLETGQQRAEDLKELVHRIIGMLPVPSASSNGAL